MTKTKLSKHEYGTLAINNWPKSNGGDKVALELEAGSGLDALPGQVEQLRLAVHVIRLQADYQVTTYRHKGQIIPVLRIRVRDPVTFRPLDPGSGMNRADHISGSLETIFWVRILKFFDADPDPGSFWPWIRDAKSSDLGSGSATLDNTWLVAVVGNDTQKCIV